MTNIHNQIKFIQLLQKQNKVGFSMLCDQPSSSKCPFDDARKKGFYLVKPKVNSTTHKNKFETKVRLMINEPSFAAKGSFHKKNWKIFGHSMLNEQRFGNKG
jgi:hypothetical protein